MAAASRRRLIRLVGGWLGLSWIGAAGAAARAGAGVPATGTDASAQPLDVSLDTLAPGGILEIEWHGKPVFVRRRTPAEIARERAVPLADLRDPEPDEARVQQPEWVIVEGICTHGGCIPTGPLGDYGGWYCLCHGSQFDTAGRVRAGPARENLRIPAYAFVDARTIRLGCDPGAPGR